MMSATVLLLLCAIRLAGVTGSELGARAFFDANNVKVGDPMVLTIDFLGTADFKDLHPPILSKAVNRADWKVDDVSAKTDTFRDARRLTYRIRPMREGVLWFPSLEFVCAAEGGGELTFRANDIPVHVKTGAQVAMGEIGADEAADEPVFELPLVTDLGEGGGSAGPFDDDLLFAWRKACANPTADAFAVFDFPAAKLNEAACAIREGNWARALKIYQKLEWRTGQTPEIERGMIAVLALKYDNPSVELPMWRQVLRPLLRHGWAGRVGIVLGGFAALALVFWLLGRGIRAVACVTVAVGLVASADAQSLFQQMEEQMNRMHRQMQQSFGGFGFQFGGEKEREAVKVTATVTTDREKLKVGEPFEFVISLEYPRTASVGQIRMTPSEMFGLTVTGQAQNLPDGKSTNPTNIIKRLAVPVRYDVPFKGRIAFSIEGMVSGRESRNGGRFSLSFSNSFECETDPIEVEILPLETDGQPADFSGIVSEGLRIHETCDILRLETNDVVTITYRMMPNGYVPKGFLPKGVAFEWGRQNDRSGRPTEIEYRRFFVADGASKTPELTVSYYDPRTKAYRTAKTGGTALVYVADGAKKQE